MSRAAAPLQLVLALVLGAACGTTKLTDQHPHLSVTPTALDFGQTPIFFPAHKSVLVGDAGNVTLHIASATLTGDGVAAYSVLNWPAQLTPGQTAPVDLACSPQTAGKVTAQLVLASDDPDSPQTLVDLTCEGTIAGSISVSPSSLDFGRVGEGETATRELKITSGGPADLYLASMTFSSESGFGVVGSLLPGDTLPAGNTATVAVRFSPTPDTQTGESVLTIGSSDPAHLTVPVALHATINRAPVARATAFLEGDPPQDTQLTTGVGATVHLDASTSSDPDGDVPLTFKWTLALKPDGSAAQLSNDTDIAPQIVLDVAGLYSIQLVATDAAGLPSFLPARIDLRAIPPLQLVVELVWDQQRPDLDLHLREDGTSLDSLGDCSWIQPDPFWFPGGPDKNPHHLGDQLVGYGPETVQWKEPAAGLYRVAVVLKNLNGSTASPTARVRIHAFGVLVAELVKPLTTVGEVWEAGSIDWPTGRVQSSRAPGQKSLLREGALWRTE